MRRLTRAKCWRLGLEWAEYEEEHRTLILGYSLQFFLLYYAWNDLEVAPSNLDLR